MKKILIALAGIVLLASCTTSRYGCYKRGRCVDAKKKETVVQRQSESKPA